MGADVPARDWTVNPEAHQFYLQGRYFANQPSTANLAKAVDFKRLTPHKQCPWVATLRRPSWDGPWTRS